MKYQGAKDTEGLQGDAGEGHEKEIGYYGVLLTRSPLFCAVYERFYIVPVSPANDESLRTGSRAGRGISSWALGRGKGFPPFPPIHAACLL